MDSQITLPCHSSATIYRNNKEKGNTEQKSGNPMQLSELVGKSFFPCQGTREWCLLDPQDGIS